jgi:hypothetical protein
VIVEPLEDSPSLTLPSHHRVSCRVTYEHAGVEPDVVWFDLPRELLNGDRSGNAWLICFLPLAVSFRERLLLRAAVDPVLIKNATEMMRIWATWDPGLKPVKIESAVSAAESVIWVPRTRQQFDSGAQEHHRLSLPPGKHEEQYLP